MVEFPTPPDSRPISDTLYQLFDDYRYIWELKVKEVDGNFKQIQNRITIPSGFRYDGASVPRIFWTLTGIKPDGLQRAAALVHDMIYVQKGDLPEGMQEQEVSPGSWKPTYGKWSRYDADRLFRRMLLRAGMKKGRVKMMYFAVRAAGWTYWKDTSDKVKELIIGFSGWALAIVFFLLWIFK